MPNQQPESELNTRLTEIETQLKKLTQLSELSKRVVRIEEMLSQPSQSTDLSERIARLEERLMLVTDVDLYGKLQELLAAGKFKEADQETNNVILEVVATEKEDFRPEEMEKFPCSAFQVIDRLWTTYSQERFGFSVQLKIYQSVGGSVDTLRTQDSQVIEKFGERIGWRVNNQWQGSNYENWDFSLGAPEGCFPAVWWKSPYGLKMATFCFLRLISCNL